jgi:GT2 family glycosyltransferase
MPGAPRVAVVVPVYNNIRRTQRFLDSFAKVHYAQRRIVVVDDGSTDGTSARLAEHHPEVLVLRGSGDLWWSGATNLGVRYALDDGFDYVLTINNDSVVAPDLLDRLLETASAHPRSIVGSRIQFLDHPDRVWGAGALMRWRERLLWQLCDHGALASDVLARRPDPFPVDALSGCGTLVPCQCYRDAGLYDARWLPQYHGDSEFTLRAARRGYASLVALRAVVYNDAENTGRVDNFYDYVFSRRSGYYWPAMLAIHLRYCPAHLIPGSLLRIYGRYWLKRPWGVKPVAAENKRAA